MLPRLSLALGLAFLAALPALCGCSSSHRRDQYYGTDKGANYQIPDAANFSSQADADAADVDNTGVEAEPDGGSARDSDPGTDS